MLSKLKPTILHRVLTVCNCVDILFQRPARCLLKESWKFQLTTVRIRGILSFSGWACNPDSIEILIDGAVLHHPRLMAHPAVTLKRSVANYSTGFSYLINVANLGSGEHEAVLFVDGLELDRSSFSVTRLSTGEFARGTQQMRYRRRFLPRIRARN